MALNWLCSCYPPFCVAVSNVGVWTLLFFLYIAPFVYVEINNCIIKCFVQFCPIKDQKLTDFISILVCLRTADIIQYLIKSTRKFQIKLNTNRNMPTISISTLGKHMHKLVLNKCENLNDFSLHTHYGHFLRIPKFEIIFKYFSTFYNNSS